MKPVPLNEWDKSLDRVIDDMSGRPLNVHSLMANNPELLNSWWDFRNYAVRGGSVDQRDCELVILRVAEHMRSWYEWASHVDRGLAAGLSIEEIDAVRKGPGALLWSERDAMLLAAIDELVSNYAISKDTREILSEYFSAQQVLDIVAIHGMYVTLGCMINTWGLELDEAVRTRLPKGISQLNFERDNRSQQ